MKHNLTRKLILYFTLVLLLFSLIIGILFVVLFTRHTMTIQKEDLEERAVAIAETLSDYMSFRGKGGHKQGGGYGAYLKFLDDIAMSEVWVVDGDAQTISIQQGNKSIGYGELPKDADVLIQKVFDGETAFSEGFSTLLEKPSVTVGAPITDGDGEIVAAVLLHAPVDGMERAARDGLVILSGSLLVALISATALAIVLSLRFIRPLQKMERTAEYLMEGNYSVQTGILQQDEIGSLAHNIDILANRLNEASKESERLEQMRRDFISNISHELRTPVTVIRGSLEALCDGVIYSPERMAEYHQQMLSDTIHLQRLVNDLLELSRLQNTDFRIEKTTLNLVSVIEDSARSMRRLAEQKKVKIIIKNDKDQLMMMEGDYERLRQMFIIVLDNAIKFSPEEKPVIIYLKKTKATFIVSILDQGSGIAKKDIPYIFDRFYRIHSDENKIGSGLGLAIAKEIAQKHSGIASCKSDPNKRTEFTFTFHVNDH